MGPLDPSAQTPSAKYLRRHGAHAMNIAFWVSDLRSLAHRLIDLGVRVALPGGTVDGTLPERLVYIVPHPKDTFGCALEFVEDIDMVPDPRRRPDFSSAYWRDDHPLTVERLSHATAVITDLNAARSFFCEAFGGRIVEAGTDAERGVDYAVVRMADSAIKLVQVVDETTPLGRHAKRHGPCIYGFTFAVNDLDSAADHLTRKGLGPTRMKDGVLEIGPDKSEGVVYGFADADLSRD
jgi:catechol 2,3-dioxygenase-like lactoylglutathione lyase family enzyme